MTATTSSTALATIQPAFTNTERLALAGFLAGYRGLTREAFTLDLRQFIGWCQARSLPLFAVRRADIETFARDLEARGRTRATVTRRLCTIAGFYKYAVGEELFEHSPAAHVRRPRLDYESHATALDRNELGALLVAAGLGPSAEHALVSLLALNGLRVPEATGADIEHLGLERGHRTLVITRKGGKVVTITLRHAFITAALDAGMPVRDVQEAASHADPRTTMRYDRARTAWTGMRPTSSPLSSPEQPDSLSPSICLATFGGQAHLSLVAHPQRPPNRYFNREPPIWRRLGRLVFRLRAAPNRMSCRRDECSRAGSARARITGLQAVR
jgi:site-specific recombinase XerD